MTDDQQVEMDYEAHEGTYSSFIALLKRSMIATALTVALVIWLIS